MRVVAEFRLLEGGAPLGDVGGRVAVLVDGRRRVGEHRVPGGVHLRRVQHLRRHRPAQTEPRHVQLQ